MEVPAGVYTTTATLPAASDGSVTVIVVHDPFTETSVPAVLPKSTALGSQRSLPVRVTTVPPAVEPDEGEIAVSVGVGVKGAEDAAIVKEVLVAVGSPLLVAVKV